MAHATHGTEERPEPEADADPVAAAQDRFAELEAALETTGWRLTCDPLFGPEQGPRAPDDPVAATHGYSYCATYTTSHDGVFFAAYRSAEAANAAAAVTEECGDRADEGTQAVFGTTTVTAGPEADERRVAALYAELGLVAVPGC